MHLHVSIPVTGQGRELFPALHVMEFVGCGRYSPGLWAARRPLTLGIIPVVQSWNSSEEPPAAFPAGAAVPLPDSGAGFSFKAFSKSFLKKVGPDSIAPLADGVLAERAEFHSVQRARS